MAFGMIMLRLLVGLTLAAHGSQKLGFRKPLVMALVAGVSEFGGGLLFASGLLTPVAALALTVVVTALAVTAAGPGRFSLDAAVGWAGRISGPWWALEEQQWTSA